MGEAGEGEAPRESAAGPEAVAAAERAMGAFGGRAGGDGRGVRSVEDMMERYIERAYASELGGMEVRTSGQTPSECSPGRRWSCSTERAYASELSSMEVHMPGSMAYALWLTAFTDGVRWVIGMAFPLAVCLLWRVSHAARDQAQEGVCCLN